MMEPPPPSSAVADLNGRSAEAPLTKRQVVREELSHAVHLAFTRGSSEVVILLLASAALEILQALAARTSYETLKVKLSKKVSDSDHKKFVSYLNQPYNFMKHADSDPDRALEMSNLKEWSRFVLYAACHDYGELFGEFTPEMIVYRMLWRIDNPMAMVPPTTPLQVRGANLALEMSDHQPLKLIGMLYANPEILESLRRSDAPL